MLVQMQCRMEDNDSNLVIADHHVHCDRLGRVTFLTIKLVQ